MNNTKRADAQTASSISKHAISKDRRTLNYKMADKHDRGRTTARRQYAAHWLWMGRKISNISRAELARVKRYTPKRSYNSIKYSNPISAASRSRASNKASVSIMAKRCTGVTKFVKRDSAIHKNTYKYVYYLNSCHTNALRWAMNVTAGAGAIVAVIFPPSAPVAGVLAGVLVIGSETIAWKQGNSDVDAVRIEDDWHWITVWSQ